MRYAKNQLRPGLTAIAAVLALSSTPLFAQTADVAPAGPVVVTPPPVVTTAATTPSPASAPLAVSKAPAPVSVDLGSASSAADSAAPAEAAPAPARSVSAAPRVVKVPPPAPGAAVATSAATVPVVAQAAPAPVTPPVIAPEPAPAPAAVAKTTQSDLTGDILPIAGAAGAAVLLLAGGALALGRRRREMDDVIYAPGAITAPAESGASPVVAAPMAATPVATDPIAYAAPATSPHRAEAASINGPVTRVPAGFDLSRFGRHTRAAYHGPTAENPSLSLKRRLKRASFFDQRERLAARGGLPTAGHAPAPVAAAAAGQRHAEYITTKAPQPPRPVFRPAYQS